LYRLELDGLIEAEGCFENNRRRSTTNYPAGAQALGEQQKTWNRLSLRRWVLAR
jgi:hypothetical protein